MEKRGIVLLGFVAFAAVLPLCAEGAAVYPATPYTVGETVTLQVGGVARLYKVVETYTGSVETQVAMPGFDTANGVFFTGQQNLTDLTFSPGSVVYRNQNIDFAGFESQFLGSNFAGSMQLNLGPDHLAETSTVLSGTGDAASSGVVAASGTLSYSNLSVLAGTNKDSVLLAVGSVAELTSQTSNWSSTVVPELNGRAVATKCSVQIDSVDAASGIVTRSFSGAILADVGPKVIIVEPTALSSLPTRLGSAMILLGLAFVGLAAVPRRT